MFGKTLRARLAASAVALLSTAGTIAFLGAGTASATVANTAVAYPHPNLDHSGCQVVVGDEADPVHRSAIGEVDVTRCPYDYYLVVRVYLDHRYRYSDGSFGPWKTKAEFVPPVGEYWYNYQLDVSTGSVCGYENAIDADEWITAANVSFDGGHTWSGLIYSNLGYWETGC
jgi:hypothetical protein